MGVDGPLRRILGDAFAAREAGDDAVGELYVLWDVQPGTGEVVAQLSATLTSWGFGPEVKRIAVGVCTADGEVQYYTFRLEDGIASEDELVRGAHTMAGRRLDLWRLSEFDITRLPATDDVWLFECVAKSNPDDRRLVAMAQVRQLAAVRDRDGGLVGLPHAERAVSNCLEAIRRTRASRGSAGNKLDMNHVWVDVWPEIDLSLDDIKPLQSKITPLSDGAGIEEVLCQGRFRQGDRLTPLALRFHAQPGAGVTTTVGRPRRSR
nr:hypothetical protein [Tessaracoccus coleopterorum]